MPSLKTIKTKIKSTGNLKKISRALEIISTIKLQKNKAKVLSAKQYFLDLAQLISDISNKVDLYDASTINTWKKTLAIVTTSEKGLCGWLNSKITKLIGTQYPKETTDIFVIGKKWFEYCKRSGYTIVWYLNLKDEITQADINPLFGFLEEHGSEYRQIDVVFSFFHSILTQSASHFTISPLSQEAIEGFLQEVGVELHAHTGHKSFELLEPSARAVTQELQKQVKNYLITAMVLQSKLAEHAGRMIAMKNAKDNCTKFIWSLTLQFNKLRQANITKEISEITAAKIAME